MTTTPLSPTVSECVFKTLRLQEQMTLESLAKQVGVTKHALIRLEQGTFSRPLEPVIDYWEQIHGYSHMQIRDAYDGFRTSKRKERPRIFGPLLTFTMTPIHPLRQLRSFSGLGLTETAKQLCVPQATLQHFEKKWKTQQSVPKELINALAENGYFVNELRVFNHNYTLWRNHQLGRD